ncbi:MAG: hypothetical protein HC893_08320, partial [Chloroflexaceae bacterium]|nr:hypothetical protein [Chloroflexaceae bacterium]
MLEARCQIGYTADGRELPIQSMIRISEEMQTTAAALGDPNFALYILALGGFDKTGLDQVVSDASKLLLAGTSAEVEPRMLQVLAHDL